MYDPPSHGEQNPELQQPLQPSRGPYQQDYHPTPSYVHRQDSAANHLTMHGGASPPPAGQVVGEEGGVNGAEQKLGDMRL